MLNFGLVNLCLSLTISLAAASPTFLPNSVSKRQLGNLTINPEESWDDDLGSGSSSSTSADVVADPIGTSKRAAISGGIQTVTFDYEDDHFNVSIGKCATRWGQNIGVWTYWNGTEDGNATYITVYHDQCDHAGIPYLGGHQLSNPVYQDTLNDAIVNNMKLAQLDFLTYLASIMCAEDATAVDIHGGADGELRKLLSLPENFWTFLFLGAGITGAINFGLYYSAYPNNTAWQKAEAGLSAGLLVLASGVVTWLASKPRLANADRQIATGATAATRRTGVVLARTGTMVAQSISSTNLVSLDSDGVMRPGSTPLEPGDEPIGGGVAIDGSTITGSGTALDPTHPAADSSAAGGSLTQCMTQTSIMQGLGGVADLSIPHLTTPFETVTEEALEQAELGQSSPMGQCPP